MSDLVQVGLAVFGLVAVALALSDGERSRWWAPFAGLAGQPFWFAFALEGKAWGLFITATAFSAVYARSAWHRIRPLLSSLKGKQ